MIALEDMNEWSSHWHRLDAMAGMRTIYHPYKMRVEIAGRDFWVQYDYGEDEIARSRISTADWEVGFIKGKPFLISGDPAILDQDRVILALTKEG
jgi:hypothetical protein